MAVDENGNPVGSYVHPLCAAKEIDLREYQQLRRGDRGYKIPGNKRATESDMRKPVPMGKPLDKRLSNTK
jgi:hypothetical protein